MIPVGLMHYVRKIHRNHEVTLHLRRAPGAGRRAPAAARRAAAELSNAAPHPRV
jgi:hypothetical protein